MAVLFGLTLFVSAFLLFLVQPLIAKMILPLLGGTPAVWNTCMVFFQAILLAGYAYAHVAPRWLGPKKQMLVHGFILLLPLAFLPIGSALDSSSPPVENPVLWLLGLLLLVVGLPFFVISTSAPLLQSWFASSHHSAAKDPYFLYAASNFGSMLALFGYPALVEPFLDVDDQGRWWTVGYVVLAGLTMTCAWFAHRSPAAVSASAEETKEPVAPLEWSQIFHWILLAFVPSSLMLGVTAYFTTDIAAIPLFWVIPLALYLLSFIVVFAKKRVLSHEQFVKMAPVALLVLVLVMVSSGTHQQRAGALMVVHLAVLFIAATVCHGELAERRPAASHLTTFFLCMSLGGVLGGLFNALLAPIVFVRVVEYPIVLVFTCLLLPRAKRSSAWSWGDAAWPIVVGGGTAFLLLGVLGGEDSQNSALPFLRDLPGAASALLVYSIPLFICFTMSGRPLRFGLCVAALFLAKNLCSDPHGRVLHRERGFFGDLHVRVDASGEFMQMFHGTTLHGMQCTDPERRQEALTYFHKTGPIGELFDGLEKSKKPKNIAVTGLGVGVLMAYAEPGQSWTYYEIDPAVVRVARDERYFTYLSDAEKRGVHLDMVLGDARLKMNRAPEKKFDLIFLDAFSSDSVPVHLLTREALKMYESKWADGGLMVFNISNRYLNLEPVLAALAKGAGLVGVVTHDHHFSEMPTKRASSWVVLAREEKHLAMLSGWNKLQTTPGVEPWTDRYSNILGTLMLWR